MEIIKSRMEDLDEIFQLYDAGTAYQKIVAEKHWQGFDRKLIREEIKEGKQWKIISGGKIACVFCIAWNDPFIWLEKDADPAIYLHRIATHPDFRGRGLVKKIAEWSKNYARRNGKRYVRMDTFSGNEKLNNYYISCGFNYLGVIHFARTEKLPEHYKDGNSSLFEIDLCAQ